jgi:hypothetical protein
MENIIQPSQESINQAIAEYLIRVPQIPDTLGVL